MRKLTVWRELLGLRGLVVEAVDADEDDCQLIVSVRARRAAKLRCGVCGRRSPGYDRGEGRRRWRTLDVGLWRCFLEADAPRVRCAEHGVVVRQFPWAEHGARHTRDFEAQVAWLAVRTSKTALTELMRISWRTVGAIVTRVVARERASNDPFEGVRRIGIDEISYRRRHRYLTVVVDHDRRRLIWIAAGRDRATLGRFFEAFTPQRCADITVVTSDGAQWIADEVAAHCPNATLCMDPFHVVSWVNDALDEVRRAVWNKHRRSRGGKAIARDLKRSRFVLWQAGERLDDRGRRRLDWIAEVNSDLYRAYLLKEQLRHVFSVEPHAALDELDTWIEEATASGLEPFARAAERVARHRQAIKAALSYDVSNGLTESINAKIRLLARIAFGFKNPDALAALALLHCGGHCPPLPTTA